MDRGDGQREMDCVDFGPPRQVEVTEGRPAPSGELTRKPQPRNGADGVDLVIAHGGRAHLQFPKAGLRQGRGDGEFFGPRKSHSRRLLAVAQGRVDEPGRGSVEGAVHLGVPRG